MPVHDCSGFTGFFIRGDDGEFHRIDRIPVMQTVGGGKYDPGDGFLQEELSVTFSMTRRSERRFRKAIHAAIMSTARKARRDKRLAEKRRREAVKWDG